VGTHHQNDVMSRIRPAELTVTFMAGILENKETVKVFVKDHVKMHYENNFSRSNKNKIMFIESPKKKGFPSCTDYNQLKSQKI